MNLLRRWTLRILRTELLLLVGSLAFSVVLGEIGLRAFVRHPRPYFHRPDPLLGHSLRPGVEGWYTREGPGTWIEISSAGLADGEYPLEKPPGTFRIAVLGDSFAQAFQVPLERSFHGIVEAALPGTEILNFGVSGYGTAQEYLLYRERVRPYRPDLVLLLFFAGNDITDNHRELANRSPRPFFTLDPGGGLRLDDSTLRARGLDATGLRWRSHFFFTDRFLVAHFASEARRRLRLALGDGDRGDRPETGIARVELTGPPETEEWREAWRVTERLIEVLDEEIRGDGARFALVSSTTLFQVDRANREAMLARKPDADLFYVEERLGRLCAGAGVPYLPLAPALQAYAFDSGRILHGFLKDRNQGHWNETAHARAAHEILAFLARESLLPSSADPP